MANYPSSLDSYTNPAGTSLLTSPDHAADHTAIHSAIVAIETTAGTTAGTNVLKNFAAGDFPARINGSNVLQQRVSGTIDNAILGTPAVSAGTWSNAQLIGTPQITGGTHSAGVLANNTVGTPNVSAGTWSNAQLIGTPQITGGTITNAALIGTSQITGGTATSMLLSSPSFSAGAVGANDLSTSAITLGYTKITSSFTTTTTPADVDVTNLAATITVPTTARNIKISVSGPSFIAFGTSTKTGYVKIKEGTTVLQMAQYTYGTGNTGFEQALNTFYLGTFSSGSHTFKVSVAQDAAGTVQVTAVTTAPAIILVEAV